MYNHACKLREKQQRTESASHREPESNMRRMRSGRVFVLVVRSIISLGENGSLFHLTKSCRLRGSNRHDYIKNTWNLREHQDMRIWKPAVSEVRHTKLAMCAVTSIQPVGVCRPNSAAGHRASGPEMVLVLLHMLQNAEQGWLQVPEDTQVNKALGMHQWNSRAQAQVPPSTSSLCCTEPASPREATNLHRRRRWPKRDTSRRQRDKTYTAGIQLAENKRQLRKQERKRKLFPYISFMETLIYN